MRAETCGEPLSLAHIPVDRVVRLVGLTDEQLAVSLDPLPDGSPGYSLIVFITALMSTFGRSLSA